jgi:hypothetical protein
LDGSLDARQLQTSATGNQRRKRRRLVKFRLTACRNTAAMDTERAAYFRRRALEAESKALAAATEESRRAWLIVARDWAKMAEQEEARPERV